MILLHCHGNNNNNNNVPYTILLYNFYLHVGDSGSNLHLFICYPVNPLQASLAMTAVYEKQMLNVFCETRTAVEYIYIYIICNRR